MVKKQGKRSTPSVSARSSGRKGQQELFSHSSTGTTESTLSLLAQAAQQSINTKEVPTMGTNKKVHTSTTTTEEDNVQTTAATNKKVRKATSTKRNASAKTTKATKENPVLTATSTNQVPIPSTSHSPPTPKRKEDVMATPPLESPDHQGNLGKEMLQEALLLAATEEEREIYRQQLQSPHEEVKMQYTVVFRLHVGKEWEQEPVKYDKDKSLVYWVSQTEAEAFLEDLKSRGTMSSDVLGEYRVWSDAKWHRYVGHDEEKEVESNVTQEGGGQLFIFEKTMSIGEFEVPALIVTNTPKPGEAAAISRWQELRAEGHHILKTEETVRKECGFWFRLKSIGDSFTPAWLQHHVGLDCGKAYRLEQYKLKTRDQFGNVVDVLPEGGDEMLAERIMGCTRSWSSSTSTNILFVKDVAWAEYDSLLAMTTGNSRKQSKRENENSRITELWMKGVTPQSFGLLILKDSEMDEKAYDGMSLVSHTFVKNMIRNVPSASRRRQLRKALAKGEMTSGNLRILFDKGLVKGDCLIVPDDVLATKFGHRWSVVTHEVNVKREKGASFFFATLNPHHQHHFPAISAQALSWGLDFLVTEERLAKDFTAMMGEFRQAMKDGWFPAHMLRTAEMSDDGELTKVGYQEVLQDVIKRYTSSGLSLKTSSFLVDRAAQGFLNKVHRDIKRLSMPFPWAAYVHVTNHFMLELAGYDLSEYDLNKAFWFAPAGRFSYPTDKFIEFYPRHGGWDLDDSVNVGLRAMKDEFGEIQGQDCNWTVRALTLRSPNGLTYFGSDVLPGEYSIVDIDLHPKLMDCGFIMLYVPDFPLYNTWNPIPVLNPEKAPKVTHQQVIAHAELPTDEYDFGPKYNEMDAVRQMYLALDNPGIGSIINPMIAYAAVFGTYPTHMPAALEQMVDALEQTPDHTAFEVIREAAKTIGSTIVSSELKVDRFIAYTRLSKKTRGRMRAGRLYEGPFSRLVQLMRAEYEQTKLLILGDLDRTVPVLGLDITNRQVLPELLDVKVPEDAMKLAGETFRKFGAEKRHAPSFKYYRDMASGLMDKINDPWVSYARRQYFIDLHDELLAKIKESGVDPTLVMVGMYQLIIRKNVKDDVIFQTGETTRDSMLDYFLVACYRHGVTSMLVEDQ